MSPVRVLHVRRVYVPCGWPASYVFLSYCRIIRAADLFSFNDTFLTCLAYTYVKRTYSHAHIYNLIALHALTLGLGS